MLKVCTHPLLDLRAFITEFPQPLENLATSAELVELLSLNAIAPLSSSEVRAAVRDLLRHGGFKPTGRSKPASEYLIKAADNSKLSSINLAVDACNAVSLHSGLPISVVDVDRAQQPFHVEIAPQATAYIFNQSEQTIDVGELLCLFDAVGACANAVKDSLRTKTSASTRCTLSVIWGTNRLPGRATEAELWYHELLQSHGASVKSIWP